ncbi:MAG: hypothetical protein M0Z46_10520 [Actinomycetota bacterium]|jgi:hypothetical protein|nr:hypothetical protein [Actinomycetota bacterium]
MKKADSWLLVYCGALVFVAIWSGSKTDSALRKLRRRVTALEMRLAEDEEWD